MKQFKINEGFQLDVERVLRVVQMDKNAKQMATLGIILGLFTVLAWLVGAFVGSLSLASAAFCTSYDVAALAISILSLVVSKQKATKLYSYGFERFEVLLVFSCASVMIFTALFMVFEGLEHLLEGEEEAISA